MSDQALVVRRRTLGERIASLLGLERERPTVRATLAVQAARLAEWLDLVTRISGEGVTPLHATARAVALAIVRDPGLRRALCGARAGPDLRLEAVGPGTADGPGVLWHLRVPRADGFSVPAFSRAMHEGLAPGAGGRADAVVTALECSDLSSASLPLAPGTPLRVVVTPVEERPVAVHGAVLARHVLVLSVTADAHVLDTPLLVPLLHGVRRVLEDPRTLETADQFTGVVAASETSTEIELGDPTEPSAPGEEGPGGEDRGGA